MTLSYHSDTKVTPDLAHCISRGFIHVSKSKHELKQQTVCHHLHCLMVSLLTGLHVGLCLLAPAWDSPAITWVRACARLVPFISLWTNQLWVWSLILLMAEPFVWVRDKAQGCFFCFSVWSHPSLCKAPWTRFCRFCFLMKPNLYVLCLSLGI